MYQPLLKCFECKNQQSKETFQAIEDLERHIAKHFSERPLYECAIRTCEIQFYTKTHLWKHCKRNHNQSERDQIEKRLDKKLKTCEILNKSIISRFTSDTEGINHFECSECKVEKFGSAESLEAHIVRCHCGGSPLYECDNKSCGGILYTYGMFIRHCVKEHGEIKDVIVKTKFQIYNSLNDSIAMSLAGDVNEGREEIWTVPQQGTVELTIFDEDEDDMESVEMNIPCEDSLEGDNSFENACMPSRKTIRNSNKNMDNDQLAGRSNDDHSRKISIENSVAGFDIASQSNQTIGCISNLSQNTDKKRQLTNHNSRFHRDANPSRLKVSDPRAQKRYKCHKCSYSCKSQASLANHIRTHTGEKPYKCNQCSFASAQRCNLNAHIRTHTGEKPFKCNKCSYASAQNGDLKKHMMSRACGYAKNKSQKSGFSEASQCTNQESTVYRSSNQDQKSQSTNHKTTLNRYANISEPNVNFQKPQKRYKCNECPYSSNRSDSLAIHIETHTSKKSYKCSQCSYASARRRNFKNHIRNHAGDKPYKCIQCSYASIHKRSLTNHIRTHTGEKPFECSKCSYACAEKGALKKHMMSSACGIPVKIHKQSKLIDAESNTRDQAVNRTLKKPFKCNQCSYSTLNASSFNAHLRTHTSGEHHNCDQRTSTQQILNQ